MERRNLMYIYHSNILCESKSLIGRTLSKSLSRLNQEIVESAQKEKKVEYRENTFFFNKKCLFD